MIMKNADILVIMKVRYIKNTSTIWLTETEDPSEAEMYM